MHALHLPVFFCCNALRLTMLPPYHLPPSCPPRPTDTRPAPPPPAPSPPRPIIIDCLGDLRPPTHFTFRRDRAVSGGSVISCAAKGPKTDAQVADECWKHPTCKAVSVFVHASTGAWTYCLRTADGPLVNPPSEWSTTVKCQGTYAVIGGSGGMV